MASFERWGLCSWDWREKPVWRLGKQRLFITPASGKYSREYKFVVSKQKSITLWALKVIVEPHNPRWKEEFNVIEAGLKQALRGLPICSIQHVGSTSIEGVIVNAKYVDAARKALSAAGYTDVGDMNVPGRYVFRQPGYVSAAGIGLETPDKGHEISSDKLDDTPLGLRRNAYVIAEGCKAILNHLNVKRVLEDEALRTEYGELVLQKILAKAGWSKVDLDELRRINS